MRENEYEIGHQAKFLTSYELKIFENFIVTRFVILGQEMRSEPKNDCLRHKIISHPVTVHGDDHGFLDALSNGTLFK